MTISVEKAKPDKLFYIVSNVVVVDLAKRAFLLLQRSETEEVFPGLWGIPGGKLEHSDIERWSSEDDRVPDVFSKLGEREAKEESGLNVEVLPNSIIKNQVFIRPDGIPVLTIISVALYKGGEVKIEEGAFMDSAWVELEDIPGYPTVKGLEQELYDAITFIDRQNGNADS